MKTFTLDPFVVNVLKEENVDTFYVAKNKIIDAPQLIFTTLLVVFHPRLREALENIKVKLDIKKNLDYPNNKNYTHSREIYYLKTKLSDSKQRLLEKELEKFFKNEGRNLHRYTWETSITTRILTGIMPMFPFDRPYEFHSAKWYKEQLKEIENISDDAEKNERLSEYFMSYPRISKTAFEYPTIVFMHRVERVDSLISFIKEHKAEIIDAAKDLPSDIVIREDVNLTRLALGLWLYRHQDKSTEKLLNELDRKYDNDEDYFGKDFVPSKDSFPSIKADAKNYLLKLYSPL